MLTVAKAGYSFQFIVVFKSINNSSRQRLAILMKYNLKNVDILFSSVLKVVIISFFFILYFIFIFF